MAHMVGLLKSIWAGKVFEEFPEVKKVKVDLIKRSIKYHRDEVHGKAIKIVLRFLKPCPVGGSLITHS